jgi:hypothetical protein
MLFSTKFLLLRKTQVLRIDDDLLLSSVRSYKNL